MKKSEKIQILLELIRKEPFRTQVELQNRLREAGIAVTQSTLSRYLRELNLEKRSSVEGGGYYLPRNQTFTESGMKDLTLWRSIRGMIREVTPAQSLLILRTQPALAAPVASAIDGMGLREVVGTIAGDDTIFLATPSREDAQILAERINTLLWQENEYA